MSDGQSKTQVVTSTITVASMHGNHACTPQHSEVDANIAQWVTAKSAFHSSTLA
jgi:hypothetical protein